MNLKAFAAGLLLAVPALLEAQTVTYSLPKTTVTVEVDAVQESFFAGPYAAYAKRFLGIDVRETDASRSYVKEVRLVTRVEADPQARYSVDTKGAEDRFLALTSQGLVSFQDKLEAGDLVWRFNPQPEADFGAKGVTSQTRTETRTIWKEVETDTAFVRVPVEEAYQVVKTPEIKAQEAADMVLKARRERFNISTGNTDATFSGEALGAAIAELDRERLVRRRPLRLCTQVHGFPPERQGRPCHRRTGHHLFAGIRTGGRVRSAGRCPRFEECGPLPDSRCLQRTADFGRPDALREPHPGVPVGPRSALSLEITTT